MGAIIDYVKLGPGTMDERQVKNAFQEKQETAEIEYGNDPYSGTIATLTGLVIIQQRFSDTNAFEQYLEQNADKYGPAMAAQVHVNQCPDNCAHRIPDPKSKWYKLCQVHNCGHAQSIVCWYAGGSCPS